MDPSISPFSLLPIPHLTSYVPCLCHWFKPSSMLSSQIVSLKIAQRSRETYVPPALKGEKQILKTRWNFAYKTCFFFLLSAFKSPLPELYPDPRLGSDFLNVHQHVCIPVPLPNPNSSKIHRLFECISVRLTPSWCFQNSTVSCHGEGQAH